MKRILIFSLLLSISYSTSSQNASSLQSNFSDIFQIKKEKYGDREYLNKTVNTLEGDQKLKELVNNNKLYLHYLLLNFSDQNNYQQLLEQESEKELQKEFINSLERDSLFNSVMHKISEKTFNPYYVPDTVSVDELLNVAVKYFTIKDITEEGNYAGKVCAGINGIQKTLSERKPHLEAFSFSTILKNMKEEKESMHHEFVDAIHELYKLELGVDKEDRLLRAQGVMFSLMRNNVQLKTLLFSEYENKKEYLPFVIITNDL